MKVLLKTQDLAKLGVRSRERRHGPERELVHWFLRKMPVKVPRNCRLSVFEEPKIEGTFPDLVLVIWNEAITRFWSDARAALGADDLKVLHHIYLTGGATDYEVERISESPPEPHLSRLALAGLIERNKGRSSMASLSKNFAIRRIIAIEAKVSDARSGIEQASLNTWFAHDSLLLMPELVRDQALTQKASSFQVSIYSQKSGGCIRIAGGTAKPLSYVSWQFNEWVWRFGKFREAQMEQDGLRSGMVERELPLSKSCQPHCSGGTEVSLPS